MIISSAYRIVEKIQPIRDYYRNNNTNEKKDKKTQNNETSFKETLNNIIHEK